jgi:hypothetical protein
MLCATDRDDALNRLHNVERLISRITEMGTALKIDKPLISKETVLRNIYKITPVGVCGFLNEAAFPASQDNLLTAIFILILARDELVDMFVHHCDDLQSNLDDVLWSEEGLYDEDEDDRLQEELARFQDLSDRLEVSQSLNDLENLYTEGRWDELKEYLCEWQRVGGALA